VASPVTLGEILRAHRAAYLQERPATSRQRAVMRHVSTCGTPALGGHKYRCRSCEYTTIAWNSCRDRHCPRCQARASAKWVEARLAKLLPTHYFHLVYTEPSELHPLVYCNKDVCFDIHFRAAAEATQDIARDEEHLGAEVGFTAVLHTWSQELLFHPHVHCVVTGGGLSQDGSRWVAARKNYFVPVPVLSEVFRGKYLGYLRRARAQGKLVYHGRAAPLADEGEFDRLVEKLYTIDWVVYAKRPFKSASVVFKYLARYTHRVAIANSRLESMEGDLVRFRARRRSKTGEFRGYRTVELGAREFIRRYLLHVLPRGYTRIRHYGLLAPSSVNTKLPFCRELLGAPPPDESPCTEDTSASTSEAPSDERPATRPDPTVCPCCGGAMLLVGIVEPAIAEGFDTS
jgi:hypothetical protein